LIDCCIIFDAIDGIVVIIFLVFSNVFMIFLLVFVVFVIFLDFGAVSMHDPAFKLLAHRTWPPVVQWSGSWLPVSPNLRDV